MSRCESDLAKAGIEPGAPAQPAGKVPLTESSGAMLMAEKASLVAGGASGASKHAAVRQEPRQQAPGQPAEGTRNQE